jgi:hypothetical protein
MRKKYGAVFVLMLILSFCCGSSKKAAVYSERTVTINNDTIHALEFEAELIQVDVKSQLSESSAGKKYGTEIINEMSDSGEVVVGFDANFRIRLGNVKYLQNRFDLKKAKFLKLRVHSPLRVFAAETIMGKRYKFSLFYTKSREDTLQFNYLEAREMK